MIIEEIVPGIDYPFQEKYREIKRLRRLSKKSGIELGKSKYLTSKLCILHYIPWKVKGMEKDIFFYF